MWGRFRSASSSGLVSMIGREPTLWVGAVGACTCFVPVLPSPLRKLQDMPTEPELDPLSTLHPPTPGPIGFDA